MAIYLAFYKGRKRENPDTTFLDRVICFVTRSRYSHVEICSNFNYKNKTGICWSSSPRDGGVRQTAIVFKPTSWDVFEFNVDICQLKLPDYIDAYFTETQLNNWFTTKNRMKYDLLGALGTKFKIFKQSFSKYFCSEIVGEFFGIKKPHRLTPITLFKKLEHCLTKITLR